MSCYRGTILSFFSNERLILINLLYIFSCETFCSGEYNLSCLTRHLLNWQFLLHLVGSLPDDQLFFPRELATVFMKVLVLVFFFFPPCSLDSLIAAKILCIQSQLLLFLLLVRLLSGNHVAEDPQIISHHSLKSPGNWKFTSGRYKQFFCC